MSRRFGRNQKRRAREALAEATQDAERFQRAWRMESELLQHVAAQKNQLQHALDDIARMLPEGSALLPPGRITATDRNAVDAIRWPLMAPEQPPMMLSFDLGSGSREWQESHIERLYSAVADVQDRRDWGGGIHFFAEFKDKEVAYSATEESIRRMPRARLHELVRDNIAEQMTRKLLEILGK